MFFVFIENRRNVLLGVSASNIFGVYTCMSATNVAVTSIMEIQDQKY